MMASGTSGYHWLLGITVWMTLAFNRMRGIDILQENIMWLLLSLPDKFCSVKSFWRVQNYCFFFLSRTLCQSHFQTVESPVSLNLGQLSPFTLWWNHNIIKRSKVCHLLYVITQRLTEWNKQAWSQNNIQYCTRFSSFHRREKRESSSEVLRTDICRRYLYCKWEWSQDAEDMVGISLRMSLWFPPTWEGVPPINLRALLLSTVSVPVWPLANDRREVAFC